MRYEAGKFLDIKGFCSVHQSKEMAIQASLAAEEEQDNDQLMMLVDQEGPLQSVVFLVTFTDLWAHFELNSSLFSAFPEEQEILLQDGISGKITSVNREKNYNGSGQSLTFVNVSYPFQKDTKASVKRQDQKLQTKLKKQNKMFQTMLTNEPSVNIFSGSQFGGSGGIGNNTKNSNANSKVK